MDATLVVLAAGIGSRYGGLKQVEAVGPGGATILDYSVFDAQRAGFGRVVFVIREDMRDEFRARVASRIEQHIAVAYAFQGGDNLPDGFRPPAGRTKPWGTGHAVLCAAHQVHEPFAVINADDFYGAGSLRAAGEFLQTQSRPGTPTYAMVGFRLRDTLSDHGTVSRGVCKATPEGWLESITEITAIQRRGTDGVYRDAQGIARVLPGETPVSMNLWAFPPDVFALLEGEFRSFLAQHAGSTTAEFYLPSGVQAAMQSGRARVRVLPTTDAWCGITHRDDLPRVTAHIADLIDRGVYPPLLWG